MRLPHPVVLHCCSTIYISSCDRLFVSSKLTALLRFSRKKIVEKSLELSHSSLQHDRAVPLIATQVKTSQERQKYDRAW